MHTFVRYLLWLLIALLPLQSGAVARMPYVGNVTGALAQDFQPMVSHDGQADMEQSAQPASEACHDAGPSVTAKAPKHSSQCGCCCVGASAPPSVHAPGHPVTFVTSVRLAAEPAMFAFIPAMPERPPRRAV